MLMNYPLSYVTFFIYKKKKVHINMIKPHDNSHINLSFNAYNIQHEVDNIYRFISDLSSANCCII